MKLTSVRCCFFKNSDKDSTISSIHSDEEELHPNCYVLAHSIGDKIDFPLKSLLEGEIDDIYSQNITEGLTVYSQLSEINGSDIYAAGYRKAEGRSYILECMCDKETLKRIAKHGQFSVAINAYIDSTHYWRYTIKKFHPSQTEKQAISAMRKQNEHFDKQRLDQIISQYAGPQVTHNSF